VDYTPEQLAAREKDVKGKRIGCGILVMIAIAIFAFSSWDGSDKGKASDEAPNSPSPAGGQAPSPASAVTASVVKPAVIAVYQQTLNAMRPCDDASAKVAKTAGAISDGRASVFDGYGAASTAFDACREAYSVIGAIQVPDTLPSSVSEVANKAKEICADTALTKQSAADKAKEIFDGDMRPSQVQDFKERVEHGQAGTIACVAEMFDMAQKAGVDPSAMTTPK